MFKKNALKTRLLGGEQLFGVWIETGSVINAEILAQTGFDFLLLDLERAAVGSNRSGIPESARF
jgi:4-hydroxy-2-oxoheptanedioate aldolase